LADNENFNDIPEFYKEIINCWVEFGGGQTKAPTNFREIRNQNIWGNKYIKFNNKSLIYKNKALDIQVSCPKMYTYRFDENFVFDNIVKIFVN
jgi:hypothetical protein